MATVHNPINFKPEDYEIIGYYDNSPPMPVSFSGNEHEREYWEMVRREWARELERVYGPEWQRKIHHCVHCGTGHIRWIVACKHIPSGDVVTFGTTCVVRLGFKNQAAFKLAQLHAKTQLQHKKMLVYNMYMQYREANPIIEWVETEIEKPIHTNNSFAHDVFGKLKKFGSISDRQRDTMVESLERDIEWSEKKEEEPESQFIGEVGERLTLEVTVHKISVFENDYGQIGLHIMSDKDGNQIRWFASGFNWLESGKTYTVKATIKKHDEYKDKKQTIVNRVQEV